MPNIKNKYGRIVTVNFDELPGLLARGCTLLPFSTEESRILREETPKEVLLYRQGGGLGDIICLKPAVEGLLLKGLKVWLAIPQHYHFLFWGMNLTLLDYAEYSSKSKEYDSILNVNLFCPCGAHESDTDYHPVKSRIDNFADYLGVSVRVPKFLAESNNKVAFEGKRVLIQLKSKNVAKDFNLFGQVAEELKSRGVFVATIDESERLQNVSAIVGKQLSEIPPYLMNFDLVVGADSGVMHLASALSLKTLWLFGPTNGALTVKYYSKAWFLQGIPHSGIKCTYPCYYADTNKFSCSAGNTPCMSSITSKKIVDSIIHILES